MRIPLPRGAYSGRSSNVNAQVCQNWFPNLDQEGGKSVQQLFPTPGLTSRVVLEAGVPVRQLYALGGVLYAVAGSNLYTVSTAWAKADIGDLDTATGYVWMSDDGTYVSMADGTSGYTYDISGATFAKIDDADFIGAAAMTQQDGYTITAEDNLFQIGGLIDPTAWDALDYTTVRAVSGDIVSVNSINRNIWVFKTKSTEIYYNSGNADFPFEKIPGADLDKGCASGGTVVELDEIPFWLTDDRQVVMGIDLQAVPVSTPQIEYQFKDLTISDATAYGYKEEGHSFYVLNFPTDKKTFVYDRIVGLWHTRASYDATTRTDKRQIANCYAYFNGYHVVGGYADGTIYTTDLDVYADSGTRIRRQAVFPNVHDPDNRRFLKHNSFEVEFEYGVGLITGQGSDPMIMMDYSDDGGHAWSSEKWTTLGKIGKRKVRAKWRRLGRSRNRDYRITITDPVKPIVIQAFADVERLSA